MSFHDPRRAAVEFLELLDKAARLVGDPWFTLPYMAHGATTPELVYRERVYCYELYHQIRVLNGSPVRKDGDVPTYVLSGEIDKSGLSVIKDGHHKPDFVWHVPGDSERNAVVMEVKPAVGLKAAKLRKDIETLGAFLDTHGPAYACGVLLLYGPKPAEKLRERVLRVADSLQVDDNDYRRFSEDRQRRRGSRSIPALTDDVRRRIHLRLHPGPRQGVTDLGTLERQPGW